MFLFFLFIFTISNYLYQKIVFKDISLKKYIDQLFILNKYLFNWSIEYEKEDDHNINNINKILAIFNHPTMLDGLFILKYLTEIYPEYKIIFVAKKELINIPFIGYYIKNNFICLERDLNKDLYYIEDTINLYMKKYNKIIIVIFPEGTTKCKETITKSNIWCKKNNLTNYNNLLCPRYAGLEIIYKVFQPNLILNNLIYYLDDNPYYPTKCLYEKDLLGFNILFKCKIISQKLNMSNINFKTQIYKIWEINDNILNIEFKKINYIYNLIDKYYNIHPNLIKKNELMYQTSKLFLLLVPISIYTNGILYGINTFCVFITSYLYHNYQKYKLLDMICSSILILLSYFYISHLYSFIFMSLGIICYLIGLYLHKIHNNINLSIFFHNLLHIFCSMHIIIEYLLIIF